MIPWLHLDRKLILASQSPRRKQILSTMGFEFIALNPEVGDEEAYIDARDFVSSVRNLAVAKAQSVADTNPSALVLGADTIVVQDGISLGKPRNREQAAAMLARLSGRVHEVITGVALVCKETGLCASAAERTSVSFRPISSEEIAWYLESGEYADKAGGYAIQGMAMVFITSIHGCYYNVVGLPVRITLDLLKTYSLSRGI